MRVYYFCLLAAAAAFCTLQAAGQTVDRYDVSRIGNRNTDGQAVYPAGVNDPSRTNPSQPPIEAAVPLPPMPETPIRAVPAGFPGSPLAPYHPADGGAAAVPKYSDGLGGPSYSPAGLSQSPASPSSSVSSPSNAYATQVYPSPAATVEAVAPRQATWYTRVDYYHWNERIGGEDFVNESGALFTLGYQRQIGIERFRAELFGGEVHYDGYGQFDTGPLETLPSNTGYLGLRGEYEMLLAPAAWEGHLAFMAGIGSRFWIRDLHDGTTAEGDPVLGYQETWWTIYPYLGAETHSSVSSGLDFYTESRVGLTAVTYNYASIGDRPVWPRPGVMANLEIGLRGERFYVAARTEVMSWEQSSTVQDAFQPHSIMYTVGGRLGFTF